MGLHKFKALEAGTLSNPFRYIEKDQIVDLTDAEAKLYAAKSKWLRPLEEVKNRPEPVLMPHIRYTGKDGLPYSKPQPMPPSPMSPGYEAQMRAIRAAEAAADGRTPPRNAHPEGTGISRAQQDAIEAQEQPGGEAQQAGTGSADPLA